VTAREVRLSQIVGRRVRDAVGRSVGRLEELRAEIELHSHGNDYVVVEYVVGAYGALEALAGARFARHLLRRLGRVGGYRRYTIPWERMDLGDPERPRLTCRAEELSGGGMERG
jgi:sporulation protein YlmC with PRC-barrel domain